MKGGKCSAMCLAALSVMRRGEGGEDHADGVRAGFDRHHYVVEISAAAEL